MFYFFNIYFVKSLEATSIIHCFWHCASQFPLSYVKVSFFATVLQEAQDFKKHEHLG